MSSYRSIVFKAGNAVSNASQINIWESSNERMLQICFCSDIEHFHQVSSCGELGCRWQWCGGWPCGVPCDFAFQLNNVENKGFLRARLPGFLMGILLILCKLQSHRHSGIHCKLLQKLHGSWWLHYVFLSTEFLRLDLPPWMSSLQ